MQYLQFLQVCSLITPPAPISSPPAFPSVFLHRFFVIWYKNYVTLMSILFRPCFLYPRQLAMHCLSLLRPQYHNQHVSPSSQYHLFRSSLSGDANFRIPIRPYHFFFPPLPASLLQALHHTSRIYHRVHITRLRFRLPGAW